MTSRSKQQVLIRVSVHPLKFHSVLVLPHFIIPIFPSELLAPWTSSFSIRHKDSLTTSHNCVMPDPSKKSLYGQIYVLMDLLL